MLKYVFMGSPPIAATILAKMCDDVGPPELVVTQTAKESGRGKIVHPTAVEALAVDRGLPILATENVSAGESFQRVKAVAPDLILVAAFGQLLRESVLSLPHLFCLNVHASLLPAYRGAAPLQWGIWNGDKVTGITIQKMVKQLDAGDILLQKELTIDNDWTSAELLDAAAKLGAEALVEAYHKVESGDYEFTPQDHKLATHAPKIDRVHAVIDWKRPAESIRNQIRALQPWPVAETRLGSDRLKIFKATVENDSSGVAPGTILTDGKAYLNVKCGDLRVLSLTEIQLENRKRLVVKDFLMAFRGNFPHQHMGHDR